METLEEFNLEGLQRSFKDGHERGNFKEVLREHWKHYVCHVYSGKQNPDINNEEKKANKFLLSPLEVFICGGEKPEEVFKELKDVANPDVICAKTFKMGEPTYACRDCGMDPTCVLCVECFQNSSHRKHRYRMSTSGGGGYCDCGDVEAWKKGAFCSVHSRGLQMEEKNVLDLLPPGMQQRIGNVFDTVIHYIIELLLWHSPDTLPDDLSMEEGSNDDFITMLFNDEVHTYDQVIAALQRAVKCSHKMAVDYATIVDREGRSIVRSGKLEDCIEAKEIIVKQTSNRMGSSKPLKVEVMLNRVVAHQTFAMKLMTWLSKLAGEFDGFRKVLANGFLELSFSDSSPEKKSLVEVLMQNDTALWKAARTQVHQLIMSVVLMDPDSKKQFAITFAKLYKKVVADFVRDDHERRVSFLSCSVQLLTNPSMAKMLIQDYDLMHVIMQTFLDECASVTVDGRFAFQKSDQRHAFKRAQYCLTDLKYALVCKPKQEEWNDKLRASFIRGFKTCLELLKSMQGMDSVRRQVNQHIEFEPEWETAFNLHLKLEDNIYMLQQWAHCDIDVLIQGMRLSLECLQSMTFSGVSYVNREALDPNKPLEEQMVDVVVVKIEAPSLLMNLSGHSALCIDYDVSKELVSIHLPVTRLVAGMFPLAALHSKSPAELIQECKPENCEKEALLVQLMEPSLRCLVLVAQVQAGMWKRNGYSLLNQVFFYSNVRCRTQMFDKDVVMLQSVGAAMHDPNQFLINLINKFGLVQWSQGNFADCGPVEERLRQLNLIAEEFLDLLVILLGERYTPGVAQVSDMEWIKREVVHLLCINPLSHSELERALPDDPYNESGVEEVVNQVASFNQPAASQKKGIYVLKPECYSTFNPNFYHYSRSDKTKAEETQRQRKKQANLDSVLPPPLMPAFTPQYAPLLQVLTCDVMLHLIRLVLERSGGHRLQLAWTETHLEKVLFLLGIAIQEEEIAKQSGCYTFEIVSKLLEPVPDLKMSEESNSVSILARLEALIGHENVTLEGHRDLLVWLIKKIYAVAGLDDSQSAVMLKSTKDPEQSKTQFEKKKKADQAARRRAKLMAKMASMQKTFIQKNEELFTTTPTELPPPHHPDEFEPVVKMDTGCASAAALCCVGPHRSSSMMELTPPATCILCQEQQPVSALEKAVVMAAYVQRSTVLSKNRGHILENPENYNPLFMPADLFNGVHVTTCGHVMHSDCWQRFYDNVIQKERRRIRFRQQQSYDIERNEYLCPYCKALGNTVMPIVPSPATKFVDGSTVELHFNDWLDGIQKTVKTSIQKAQNEDGEGSTLMYVHVPRTLSSITKTMTESVARNFQAVFECLMHDPPVRQYSESIVEMMKKFSQDIHVVGLDVQPDSSNMYIPPMLWNACAFTIKSIENMLRLEEKPVFEELASRQHDCLASLVRLAASCHWEGSHSASIQQFCISLLSALVLEGEGQLGDSKPCLVQMDLFHYLVSLTFSLPYLYGDGQRHRIPTGDLNDLHVLALVTSAHIVQAMLTVEYDEEMLEFMDVENDDDSVCLLSLYHEIRKKAKLPVCDSLSPWKLKQYLHDALLPFLRSAALFYHNITDVPSPENLRNYQEVEAEFESLCTYLCLPPQLSHLFQRGHILNSLVCMWSSQCMDYLQGGESCTLTPHPFIVNQLVQLPNDYSDIINAGAAFTCPNSNGDESRAPTMCLVCGQMLCSQSYCCQTKLYDQNVGSATAHAHTCGAGTGVFLRVRECQILLLSGQNKGCFYSPPYLDMYGETDQGLRRGNPLYLSIPRYQQLQRLWLSHGIPEEIAHSLEGNAGMMTIDWNHL